MKYWFDTEFHDDGNTIQLISIGIVVEDGREYYAESSEYDWSKATDWLRSNVFPYLENKRKISRAKIKSDIENIIADDNSPEFWADCGEYDWIVLRQLFGSLEVWPSKWPIFCMDIAQWKLHLLFPHQFKNVYATSHNALEDARIVKKRWQELNEFSQVNNI